MTNQGAGSPYERFAPQELILRDELAIDRTLLANERTLLAYLRSAIALLLAGVTFVHFAQDSWFLVVGVLCLPAGLAAGGLGIARFRSMHAKIAGARRQAAGPPSATPLQDEPTREPR